MKSLVVYFSRKGYVRRLAEARARELGADIVALKTPEHTEGILGFWWCGRFGMHRWGMELAPLGLDLSNYERVVICSPIWVFGPCAPVRRFVEQAAGKIRAVDYMLVHFSAPAAYPGVVAALDRRLGIRHGRFTSVCCMWGRILYAREMPAASLSQ